MFWYLFFRCMCSYGRCPESMWLFNNSWHRSKLLDLKKDYELDADYIIKPIENHNSMEQDHLLMAKPISYFVPESRKSLKSDVINTSNRRSAPIVVRLQKYSYNNLLAAYICAQLWPLYLTFLTSTNYLFSIFTTFFFL